MTARLVVRSLSKQAFGRAILASIDLEIAAGSAAVVIGASGTGKSTLLRILCGLEEATGGSVRLVPDLLEAPEQTQGRIGLCPQDAALLPYLNVRDNLAFPMRAHGVAEPVVTGLVNEAVEHFGLRQSQFAYPTQLSPEIRQSAVLARAVARPRDLYLFDEALNGFPSDARRRLIAPVLALLRLRQAAALWVTHDAEDADHLEAPLFELRGGSLIAVEPPTLEANGRAAAPPPFS